MAKQMTEGVRKAAETFCLTAGVYTCILLAVKFSRETDVTERRDIVSVMVGFAVVSMIYCLIRILIEGRKIKETSNQ